MKYFCVNISFHLPVRNVQWPDHTRVTCSVFLGNCPIVFHSGYSRVQYKNDPISLHPDPHFVSLKKKN